MSEDSDRHLHLENCRLREKIERLEADLSETHSRQIELVQRLAEYENSPSTRLARRMSHVAAVVAPPGSSRRRIAGKAVRAARARLRQVRSASRSLRRGHDQAQDLYEAWLRTRTPSPLDLDLQRLESSQWRYKPLISVCMPVYNPDPAACLAAIASVQAQSYENWELCIADDSSTRTTVLSILETQSVGDPRVKMARSETREGISHTTNRALHIAAGEFVAFLDQDDILAPHALYVAVKRLQDDPAIDFFYCDEDVLTPSGQRALPLFKPDWSPELLLGRNYITHFVIARRRVVEQVGGLRPERDGAQDHDLALRLTELTQAVHHIPEVLYTWRQAPSSTAMTAEAKPWAAAQTVNAVRDALQRRGVVASVEPIGSPGGARVSYHLPQRPPHVEILIPTRDHVEQLRQCVESIGLRTDYPSYSIAIIDNDSRDPETLTFLRESGLRVIPAPGPFNYSAIINRGVSSSDAAFILTLNNDTRILESGWLRHLLELALQPRVGAVGCRLVLPDGRPQHEGIILARTGPQNLSFQAPGIRTRLLLESIREVTAVTGACCLSSRRAWETVAGLDEALPVAYNDVDYCLRLRANDFRILYTPFVTVEHAEGASRGELQPTTDLSLMRQRWYPRDHWPEPYFSPHLTGNAAAWRFATDVPLPF